MFVTKKKYKGTFSDERGCDATGKPDFVQDDVHPVVCVTWNDAVAYADRLSQETGLKFALPSEAQWEYIYRAALIGLSAAAVGAATSRSRVAPIGSTTLQPVGTAT
jgi:formylglycine-generating enzyme required for sulfatase activity